MAFLDLILLDHRDLGNTAYLLTLRLMLANVAEIYITVAVSLRRILLRVWILLLLFALLDSVWRVDAPVCLIYEEVRPFSS